MNIPHYLEIITHPMDFKTIEERLDNSMPGKGVPKPYPSQYSSDQFTTDVWLVFYELVGALGLIFLTGTFPDQSRSWTGFL